MDMPWKALAPVERGREYLVLLSYLPLRAYRKIPVFFRYTSQIQRQLRNTPGAIGYSMRAKVLSRKFWTLSVWENERALRDFISREPHRDAMNALTPHMGPTKFTQWKAVGSALPPDWGDAVRRESKES
jgi:heme-degrading monooxygenase HmoA